MSQADLLLQQAYQHHQNQEYKEAEEIYRTLLEKGTNNDTSIYLNLSDALNQQGDQVGAKELLKNAAQQHSNNPQLKLMLAQQCMGMQEIAEATELNEALIADFPEMGEAYYLRGNLCMQQQNLEGALLAFEKTISLLPQMAEAHYNAGVLLYEKRELEKAEEYWKQAVGIQPALLPAWLNLGNLALELKQFQKAIDYLNSVLAFDPEHFSAIKMIGMAQHALGNIDEALESFLKIHNKENPLEDVLTLIANAYRDLDRVTQAEEFYIQVLDINPDHEIAKDNLQKIDQRKIEGWHFSMLGDLGRNKAYDDAIQRNVKPGDLVLDIGTGSGLLSMMSAKAGADKVYTCETIQAIANVAKQVIKDNNYSEKIEVFNLKSSGLKVGKEIPKKADIIVSEILDVGLLGEGVIPTIRHAQENLLKKDGILLPMGARVIGMLVESEHLRSRSPIKEISGFDLTSFSKFQYKDSYSKVFLNNTPYKSLSRENKIWDLDFYKLPKVALISDPNLSIIEIEVVEDGEIHAIAFWFDLQMDKELSVSSGPNGEMIHWGQAFCGLPGKRKVNKGDIVRLTLEQSETNITIKYADE